MLYLDTSLLISAVGEEVASERADALLATPEDKAISDWSLLEFASGVAVKHRGGQLSGDKRLTALQWLRHFSVESAQLLPVSRQAMRRAADAINTGVKVRGADALHLAIAEEFGATLCTLDDEQASAGEAMAVRTRLI